MRFLRIQTNIHVRYADAGLYYRITLRHIYRILQRLKCTALRILSCDVTIWRASYLSLLASRTRSLCLRQRPCRISCCFRALTSCGCCCFCTTHIKFTWHLRIFSDPQSNRWCSRLMIPNNQKIRHPQEYTNALYMNTTSTDLGGLPGATRGASPTCIIRNPTSARA